MATSSKREGLTNNSKKNKRSASESSGNLSSLTLMKLMQSFKVPTPTTTLISRKLENYSLSRSKKPSTTTSHNNPSLSIGLKFSPIATLLASTSKKEMNPF